MSWDLVLKFFIKTRVMAKDIEHLSRDEKGPASVAYKSTGLDS